MRVRMADGASATPSSPPAKARRTLSARSCLPMRHPRSAQSQASTDFMVASRSTRQEETGNIQAGETQQDSGRGE